MNRLKHNFALWITVCLLGSSVTLNFHLARKNKESYLQLESCSKEHLDASLAVSKLSECLEPSELGPDQGCKEQVGRVVDFGEKAIPYLLAAANGQDMHTVLNVFRCLNKIQPQLSSEQLKEIIKIRNRIKKSMENMEISYDPVSIVSLKMIRFVAIEIDDFIHTSKSSK